MRVSKSINKVWITAISYAILVYIKFDCIKLLVICIYVGYRTQQNLIKFKLSTLYKGVNNERISICVNIFASYESSNSSFEKLEINLRSNKMTNKR